MERYGNVNHLLNRKPIVKTASVYDGLAVSNRRHAPQLEISSLGPKDNEDLREHIQKTASAAGDHELLKMAGTMDKEAFLSGGLDLFTRAKGLVGNKLGVTDEAAHSLASPVVNKTLHIQQNYGGDPTHIMDRLVESMQNQMMDAKGATKDLSAESVHEVMSVVNTKSLEEHIKERLMKEVGLTSYEADRYKKIVVGEARSLVTMIRPYKMDVIADAIVELIKESQDISVAMNVKDSSAHVASIRSILEHHHP